MSMFIFNKDHTFPSIYLICVHICVFIICNTRIVYDIVCDIVYLRWPESSDGKNISTFGKPQSRCLLQIYIWSNNVLNHKVRHVVGSILISKYRSWCTLTFLKCVKNGKLCQNATLKVLPSHGAWVTEATPVAATDLRFGVVLGITFFMTSQTHLTEHKPIRTWSNSRVFNGFWRLRRRYVIRYSTTGDVLLWNVRRCLSVYFFIFFRFQIIGGRQRGALRNYIWQSETSQGNWEGIPPCLLKEAFRSFFHSDVSDVLLWLYVANWLLYRDILLGYCALL